MDIMTLHELIEKQETELKVAKKVVDDFEGDLRNFQLGRISQIENTILMMRELMEENVNKMAKVYGEVL